MIVLDSPVKSMTSQLENFSLHDSTVTGAAEASNEAIPDGKTETSSEKTNHPSIVKVSPLKRDRPVTRNSKKDVLKKDEPTLKPQGKTGNNKILISPKKKSKQNLDCEIPANDSIQTSSTNQNSPTQMNLPNQNSETASTNHIQSSESSQQTKRSLKFDDGKSQKNENESNEIQVEGSDAKESTVNQPKESNSEETIEKSSSNDETQRSANSTCNDDCEKPEKASNVENKLHQKVKKLKPRRSKSVDLFGNQLDLHAESSDPKLTQHNRATKSRKGRKQKSIDDLSIANSKVTDFYQYRRSDRRLGGKAWTKEDIYEKLVKENCQDGLKIVEFPGKGRGIVATKTFERNDFVVEYKGDLITPQEAKTREEKFENDPDVGCYMYYFVHGGIRYCIDATKELESYGYGRLLNHSRKKANCRTKSLTVDGKAKLILIANRTIDEGEEMLYDYGDRSKTALENHPWLAQ